MMSNQPRYFPSIVKLNVGGQHFTTSLQTLTRDPYSMLAAMFSGRHEVQTTEDGSFFIDRDGTYFRFILNYLRNGELILPGGSYRGIPVMRDWLILFSVKREFNKLFFVIRDLKVLRDP